MTGEQRIYTLTALTHIWTGDADGKPGRLITTGLLGSIRWWFEVVVRGLGGSACDPTLDGNRCPNPKKDPADPGHHCVVCELFGCTGWARKFRFDVLGENDQPKQTQIQKGQTFKLRFTELRSIRDEEWALLDLTIRLIAEYGAIGGKTVYKPTEETSRQSEQHHQDFGLITLLPTTQGGEIQDEKQENDLRRYVSLPEWRKMKQGDFAWASLQHFWCVRGKHLSREDTDHSSFNRVLGSHESKKCRDCGKVHNPPQKCPRTKKHPQRYSDQNPTSDLEKWLAGGRAESKKVFSFKDPESARRTFGFVRPSDQLDKMRERLRDKAWADLNDDEFLTGDAILRNFLAKEY